MPLAPGVSSSFLARCRPGGWRHHLRSAIALGEPDSFTPDYLIRAAVHSRTKGVLDFRYESKRQETGFGGNAFCSALRKTLESGVTRSSEVIARERSRVNEWEQIYERLYDDGVASRDSEFDIVGWDSSYTGDPLSRSEMQEQVDFTVDRIRALGGRRILEIGCAPVYCCFAWRIIVPAMWAPISLRLLSPV